MANFPFSFIILRDHLTSLHGIPENPLLATGILRAAPLTILITLIRKIITWEPGMLNAYPNPHSSHMRPILLSQIYK